MFERKDVSQVKTYVQEQFHKIMTGRVSIQDFIFAKEVRLGTYSERGVLPPAVVVAKKNMEMDPRDEPRYSERVRYLVVYGSPDARLTDLVVSPQEFISK